MGTVTKKKHAPFTGTSFSFLSFSQSLSDLDFKKTPFNTRAAAFSTDKTTNAEQESKVLPRKPSYHTDNIEVRGN